MTQYLLDTHALIWFLNEKEALSKEAKKIIEPVDTICYISIASLWEIAIKSALNKLELKTSFMKLKKDYRIMMFRYYPSLLRICFLSNHYHFTTKTHLTG